MIINARVPGGTRLWKKRNQHRLVETQEDQGENFWGKSDDLVFECLFLAHLLVHGIGGPCVRTLQSDVFLDGAHMRTPALAGFRSRLSLGTHR
jgi:hypothetical protein